MEYPAGATVNNGQVLSGARLVFLTGSRELGRTSQTAGFIDLTATGEVLFLNAVNYMGATGGAAQVTSSKELVDSDHDGMSDLAESIAGTNPADPNEFFHISKISQGEDGMTIEFNAVAGIAYEIEFSEDLSPNSWQIIGSASAGEASAVEFLDTDETRAQQGFYRGARGAGLILKRLEGGRSRTARPFRRDIANY